MFNPRLRGKNTTCIFHSSIFDFCRPEATSFLHLFIQSLYSWLRSIPHARLICHQISWPSVGAKRGICCLARAPVGGVWHTLHVSWTQTGLSPGSLPHPQLPGYRPLLSLGACGRDGAAANNSTCTILTAFYPLLPLLVFFFCGKIEVLQLFLRRTVFPSSRTFLERDARVDFNLSPPAWPGVPNTFKIRRGKKTEHRGLLSLRLSHCCGSLRLAPFCAQSPGAQVMF